MVKIFNEFNLVDHVTFSERMVDKDDLTEEKRKVLTLNLEEMTAGKVCCSASHFNLWDFGDLFLPIISLSEEQYPPLYENRGTCNNPINMKLILEDDIRVLTDFPDKLKMYIDVLSRDNNWDIALLSRNCFGDDLNKCFEEREKIESKESSIHFLVPKKLGFGAHTYVVHKRAVEKLIKISDKSMPTHRGYPYPLSNINDVLFNKWHDTKVLNFYVTRQHISEPLDPNDSDTN